MESKRKTDVQSALVDLNTMTVTPELSKKFRRFLEQVITNKEIYFGSQDSEGSENSEGSESSENSEASEDSEGSESEFFEALLAVDPSPAEWGKVLVFGNVVQSMLNR